jgi:hypothetical protein
LEDFVRRVAAAAMVRSVVIRVRVALVVLQPAPLEVLPVMAAVWVVLAQVAVVKPMAQKALLPAILLLVVRRAELAEASLMEVPEVAVEIACLVPEVTALTL